MKENEFPKVTIRTTRYRALGFAYFGPSHWQFIDLSSKQVGGWNTVGMIYPRRSELEADIERFAQERGYL